MRKNRRIKRRRKRKKQAPLAFQAASTTEGSQKNTPFFSHIYVTLKTQHFSPVLNRDSLVDHVDLQYLVIFSPCEWDCYKTTPRSSSNLPAKLQSLQVVQRGCQCHIINIQKTTGEKKEKGTKERFKGSTDSKVAQANTSNEIQLTQ